MSAYIRIPPTNHSITEQSINNPNKNENTGTRLDAVHPLNDVKPSIETIAAESSKARKLRLNNIARTHRLAPIKELKRQEKALKKQENEEIKRLEKEEKKKKKEAERMKQKVARSAENTARGEQLKAQQLAGIEESAKLRRHPNAFIPFLTTDERRAALTQLEDGTINYRPIEPKPKDHIQSFYDPDQSIDLMNIMQEEFDFEGIS